MGAAIHATKSCPQICLALPFNARGSQLQKCLLTLESCAQQPPRFKKAILNINCRSWSFFCLMIFLAEGRHIQVTGRHIIALFRCIASGSHQIIKVAARVWFRPSTPEALNLSLTRFQGWLPARVKWTKTKNSVNGKLYAPPFDADFVLGRCICARCARSVMWTSTGADVTVTACHCVMAEKGRNKCTIPS